MHDLAFTSGKISDILGRVLYDTRSELDVLVEIYRIIYKERLDEGDVYGSELDVGEEM